MNEAFLRERIARDFGNGNLTSALETARTFLHLFPESSFGWKAVAAVLIQGGQLSGARVPLLKAIAIDPSDADNWVNLGNLERGSGNPTLAIDHYNRAIMLRPDFQMAKINLATVLGEQGETKPAIDMLEKILASCPRLATAQLTLGNIYKAEGNLENAENRYRAALEIDPAYFEAHLNLSSVWRERGNLAEALVYCRKAIALKPNSAMAHSNLGNIFAALRQFKLAVEAYQTAIRNEPKFFEAYLNLSNVLRQTGRTEDALQICNFVIDSGIDLVQARLNLCFCLFERRRHEEAKTALTPLLQRDPRNAAALMLYGLIESEAGSHNKALEFAESALSIAADDPYVQLGAGSIRVGAGNLDLAKAHFLKAIEIDPHCAEAHLNLANLLFSQGEHIQALASLSHAVEIFPEFAQAYATKALIFRELRKLDKAIEAASQAHKLRPDLSQVNSTIGLIKLDLGLTIEASEHLAQAIEGAADQPVAILNYANSLRETGKHSISLELYRRSIEAAGLGDPALLGEGRSLAGTTSSTKAIPQACSNYLLALNYHTKVSDAELYTLAKSFAPFFGSCGSRESSTSHSKKLTPDKKRCNSLGLRVGFVSGDLREHPVGYFTESLFERLRTAGLQLFAYPTTPAEDELTERIRGSFEGWRPIYGATDQQASLIIESDCLDVLIDLSGHTAANRLGVFALKPAPVQLTWLGYCGTTGLNEIDYIIADEISIKPDEEHWYSEKVLRLAGSYACMSPLPNLQLPSSPPIVEHGYCTFGCFNNLAKIDEKLVKTWSNVLLAVDRSKLLLKSRQFADHKACQTTADLFLKFGVDPKRLIFESAEIRYNYLRTYQFVDIALDPFPYPGFTTSLEALWMGVPVLTMRGGRFIQRNGEGILTRIGLDEWIAIDEDDYILKAICFGNDANKISSLRKTIRQRLSQSPLMDMDNFAKQFAALLSKVATEQYRN